MQPLQQEYNWKNRRVVRWGASEQFSTPIQLKRLVNLKEGDQVNITLHRDYSYTVFPPKYYAMQQHLKEVVEKETEGPITDDDWEQSMKELGLRD